MAVPFTAEVLSRVIDKRRPVRTPIRDRHFPRAPQYGTPNVGYDILTGPEGIAVAISHGAQSLRASREGWTHLSIEVPRFSEHDVIKAADLVGQRAPGQISQSEALMQRYNRAMDKIRGKFDRTLEYMCFGAFRGQVLDGGLNVLATYGVRAAEPVTFNADGSGDDPFLVFRNAVRAISRTLGMAPGQVYAYCGDTAFDLLSNEKRVVASRATVGGNPEVAVDTSGVVTRIGTVNVENYMYVWADADGADQVYVAADEILLVPQELDGEIVLGPCEAPSGLVLLEWLVDSWADRDPPATKIRVETNRLPMVGRPDAIYRLTVSGA